MVIQDLQIGDVTLEGVLTLPEETSEDRERTLREIEELTKDRKKSLGMESSILQSLIRERQIKAANLIYPRLDLSFLGRWSNELEYQGEKIHVPRFSVYGLDKNEFSMDLISSYESQWFAGTTAGSIAGLFLGSLVGSVVGLSGSDIFGVGAAIGMGGGVLAGCIVGSFIRDYTFNVGFSNLPEIFTDQLVNSIEFAKYCDVEGKDNQYTCKPKGVPRGIIKKHRGIGNITLTSHLHGLVPAETKERIGEAGMVFTRNNLYLIAETYPEEWNIERLVVKSDPVVVGVLGKDCFYVDRFNTTNLEDYVSREFTV